MIGWTDRRTPDRYIDCAPHAVPWAVPMNSCLVLSRFVVIEWVANPVNDMYADAVLAVVLKADNDVPRTVAPLKVDKSHFNECLMELLGEMFSPSCVDRLIRGEKLRLVVDQKDVWIDLRSLDVQCEDDEVLQQMVSTAVTKLHSAITPVKL